MATAAWSFYNQAKRYIADNTIDLDGTTFDLHLFQSSANFATKTLSTLGELTNEVASANKYTKSGKQMTVTWSTGASASEMRWDASDIVVSASGGNISNVKAAVIVARTGASARVAANKLLAYASLSSGQFTINDGNTLTISPSANGVFELN